jgi:hypothetical protein
MVSKVCFVEIIRYLPFGILVTWLLEEAVTQSYDFMCMEPRRILLNTVIPGWSWSGITADCGKQKTQSCGIVVYYVNSFKYN